MLYKSLNYDRAIFYTLKIASIHFESTNYCSSIAALLCLKSTTWFSKNHDVTLMKKKILIGRIGRMAMCLFPVNHHHVRTFPPAAQSWNNPVLLYMSQATRSSTAHKFRLHTKVIRQCKPSLMTHVIFAYSLMYTLCSLGKLYMHVETWRFNVSLNGHIRHA